MDKISRCTTGLAVAGIFLFSQAAFSQEPAANETVADRARPELDATGIRLGSFRLFPKIDISGTHNSNIFALEDGEISDVIYVLEPGVELKSDWGSNLLNLGADAAVRRFKDYGNEDHDDYTIWADGRIDVTASSSLAAGLQHARRHEDRESPDDARGLRRTEFDLSSVTASYTTRPEARRLYAHVEAEYRKFDFQDSVGELGPIDNDDRDRSEFSGTIRVGYAVMPTYSIFLQGNSRTVAYDDRFDNGGFRRDSEGYEISVGTALDFSDAIFGDLFVGYRSHTHDDERFADIDGFSFGADLAWNISGLTTLSIFGRRTVEPTTIVAASGVEATRFGLGIDHELLRNLILGLEWSTVEEDFQGIDRRDNIDTIDFSARYLMNRRAELVLAYSYRRRDSDPLTAPGLRFSRDLISLTVKLHL